jgi:hypothetical protein
VTVRAIERVDQGYRVDAVNSLGSAGSTRILDIPYTVNVPLWSDGAAKDRFLVLPDKGKVVFKEHDQWAFPVGTVLVKTFLLNTDLDKPEEMRRLETRLLVHNPRGWEGYTYVWNEEQDEANLLADWPLTRTFDIKTANGPVKREWYFPSRSDCQPA